MEPPSRIILPYIEESANIVYTEASHLLVNCTLLTNKRTIYLSIYLHYQLKYTAGLREIIDINDKYQWPKY